MNVDPRLLCDKMIACNSQTVSQIQTLAKETMQLTQEFSCIADSYVSDYFMKDHWVKINHKWRDILVQMSHEEYVTFLDHNVVNKRCVWPLSMLAYRAAVQSLALHRNPVQDNRFQGILRQCLNQGPIVIGAGEGDLTPQFKCNGNEGVDTTVTTHDTKSQIKDIHHGQYLPLDHIYRKHVKPKKQHEITKLSQLISSVCHHCECNHVVDVGGGQGHLSRLLSFGFGHEVTTVEAASCHAPKAEKFDKEVLKAMEKKKIKHGNEQTREHKPLGPKHVVSLIDSEISVDSFLKVVQSQRGQNDSDTKLTELKRDLGNHCEVEQHNLADATDSQANQPRQKHFEGIMTSDSPVHKNSHHSDDLVLTGLHACGDLSTTMIRMYTESEHIRGLVSVACCYHKLTTKADGGPVVGYPMCTYIAELELEENAASLSWEKREMACHFCDAYRERLLGDTKESTEHLKTHVYRAALQCIVLEKNPNFEHGSIKVTVKRSHQMDFERYAKLALKKLNLDDDVSEDQLRKCEDKLKHWKDVVAYYTVRLSLAPVVETLILLDRMLFLWEKGYESLLLPLFDPLLSPRNFALVSMKKKER